MSELPNGLFRVGRKLMGQCEICGKVVRVDKPIFGALHVCASPEEKEMYINTSSKKDVVLGSPMPLDLRPQTEREIRAQEEGECDE